VDLAYTPDQVALQERAAAYACTLFAYEDAVESSGGHLDQAVQRELDQAARDAGLWAVNMPVEWGGAGLSVVDRLIVQEQIGKATNCLWDFCWWPANVLAYGTEEQRQRYLLPVIRGERRDAFAVTEAEAGSDAGSIRTTATRVDEGWRIDGEKWFVTCGDVADFLIVHANAVTGAAGAPGTAGADGGGEPTLFLVDKDVPGVEILHTPQFMHTTVFGHPQIGFDGVVVPDSAVLGGVGRGFELTKEWFVEERLSIAARAIGAAERGLDLARDWAVERRQFGAPIADFQLVQAMLADCAVDIAVNRAYYHQVAWEIDAGGDQKQMHAKASIAKLSASEAAGRVIDRCLQVFGGRGYDRSNPVERLYRELRVDRIWEGTSEIQRLIVANELVKRGTDVLDMPR
jgi:alkylation response protein AidB-like acyl-CoA dehydrogenase